MPFASLPSSPGFAQPQAPDWTRFAAQANEFIQRGGEMRAQAGKDMADSIEKAASQIDSIIQNNSPEVKMAKALKREALKAQMGLYQEYKSMTPEQRAKEFEFRGGMLMRRDKNKSLYEAVKFNNSLLQGDLLRKRLRDGGGSDYDNRIRALAGAAPSVDNTDDDPEDFTDASLNTGSVGEVQDKEDDEGGGFAAPVNFWE